MRSRLGYVLLGAMLFAAIVSCKPSLTDNITSAASVERVTSNSLLTDALIVTADVVIQADAVKQPVLSQFAITPSFVWLNPYEEVTLVTTALDQYNQPFEDFEILWELREGVAGTISQDGNFTAGAEGGYFSEAISATATQMLEGVPVVVKAEVAVLVEQLPELSELASIQVVPGDTVAFQGQLLSLMTFGVGNSGVIIPDVLFSWEVMDSSWGKLVGEDTVKVLAPPGEYSDVLRVTGRYGAKEIALFVSVTVADSLTPSDAINVQIIPRLAYVTVGEEYRFDAIALDANGELIKAVVMSWESELSAGELLPNGVFRAGNIPGVYTDAVKVEASLMDSTDSTGSYAYATIIVEPVVHQVLTSISLLPASSVVGAANPVQYRTYAFDENGGLIPGVAVHWEVNEDVMGTVSEYGRFVANGPAGYYPEGVQITVSHDGVDLIATADVTIVGSLKKAVVWPTEVELAPGDIVLFRASGVDENNVEISSLVVDFRLVDPTVGSITPYGYFIAGDVDGDYKAIVEARVVQLH